MDWWMWLIIGVVTVAGIILLLGDDAPNDFYEGQ